MSNIVLNKKQSKRIAEACYGDIKRYCDDNLERFLLCYLDERKKSDGQPIEPITIRFYPYNHYVEQSHVNDGAGKNIVNEG